MISEPIEVILAVVLVTIAIAAAISFTKVVTEHEIGSERILARSMASVIADVYSRDFVMNGNLTLRGFRNKVGEICTLVWNRTGIWFNVSVYLVYLNGTEIKFYINSSNPSRPVGDVVIVTMPVMSRCNSSEIHWYVISYRDPYYTRVIDPNHWEGESARFYIVAYTKDGLPVQGGNAQVTLYADGTLITTEGANLINGICKITIGVGIQEGAPAGKYHAFVDYTGPNGENFPTRQLWIDLDSGDPVGRGENQMIVNETTQPAYHFYIGDTVYGRSCNRMNLASIRENITFIGLPETLDDIIYAQGPYNATIEMGGNPSTKANVPIFIFPYTVKIEVIAVAPKG